VPASGRTIEADGQGLRDVPAVLLLTQDLQRAS